MILGILKEPESEKRVIITPDIAATYIKKNITVILESDAGKKASFSNEAYTSVGVLVKSRTEVLKEAEMIGAINLFEEFEGLKNKIIIGQYQALFNKDLMDKCKANGNIIFSIDKLPRTTRAQSMDVLSSQANIAGYKSVLLAAQLYPRYFPMFMTAAGSIPPAKILILGAGVAGLQAIATGKRLGAVIEVFDTRPAVKEEVQSLGAKFVEVEGATDASASGGYAVEQSDDYKQKQVEKIAQATAKADIIICTAQIPGKKAPILITNEMISSMRNGSVIVDLAASTGGNTTATVNNETIDFNGITIAGYSNLPSSMPSDASKLYAKNIFNFISLMIDKDGNINTTIEDDIVKGTLV